MSRIRFKTIHEIQIVFGRQFAFVSLKDVTPKVYGKDDKTVADDFNNFFASAGKSTNSKIESLAEEHNFVLYETLLLLNVFLLVSNLRLIMLIVNK